MNAEQMSKTHVLVWGECLASPMEPGVVTVEGIVHHYALKKSKLEEHRAEVVELLSQFPDEFYKGKGGGWSFLNLCNTKDGEQWTGFHMVMEQLVALGQGLGLAHYMLERDAWSVMPGGMPYVVIDLEGKAT